MPIQRPNKTNDLSGRGKGGDTSDLISNPAADPVLRPFLARAVAGGGLVQAAGMLLTFLVGVQLARGLGAEAYGQYGVAMAVIALAGVVGEFGLPRLVTREMASASAGDDMRAVLGVVRWSSRFVMVVATGLAVIVALLAYLLLRESSPALAQAIIWGAILIPLLPLVKLCGASLQGLHHVVLGQVPAVLLRPLIFSLLLFPLFALSNRVQPAQAIALNAAAAAAALALGTYWLWKRLPAATSATPRTDGRRWLASAFILGLSGGMWLLQGQLTILILAFFGSDTEVAMFRIGLSTVDMLAVPMTLITIVTSPMLAALSSSSATGRLQRLVTVSARLQFAGVLALALPLLLAAEPILRFVFGPEYETAAGALRILSIGLLASAAFGVNATLLNMSRHELKVSRALAVGLAANVLLAMLLIPAYGSVGAAWAYCGSLIAWNVIAWADARRLLGVSTFIR